MYKYQEYKPGQAAIWLCNRRGKKPSGLVLMKGIREALEAISVASKVIGLYPDTDPDAALRAVLQAREIEVYNPWRTYDPTPTAPSIEF